MTHICLHTKKAEGEEEKRQLGETTHLQKAFLVSKAYTGLAPTDLGAKHHFLEKKQPVGIKT